MERPILEVKNVHKSFNGNRAVDGVSFEVYPGEIMGLLGPNGAGKTTIIRMIMDIIAPDQGEIIFSGFQLNKKKLGYLPEERGLYEDARVMDTILYFAELNDMDQKKALQEGKRWLERLELSDYADKKIEELSKGMQQKVQFVVSMIHKPRLLVLDELFSGLDPVNQDLFKEIVKDLSKSGITVLLSSHRMNMVEELCDRIFLINQGKRVLYGNLEEIKENFGQRNVEMVAKDGVRGIQKNSYVRNLVREKNKVKFSIDRSITIEDFISSLNGNVKIEELVVTKPSLHSIFVSTIKGGQRNAG